MRPLNDLIRKHQLTADWDYRGVCAQCWPIWDVLSKKYFPSIPRCYFRHEAMPIRALFRFNDTNGVGARYDFTLNTRLLGSPKIDIVAAMLHCQVHIWQSCNGVKSLCGVHNKAFLQKAAEIGIPADKNRACKVLEHREAFRGFVAKRVPNYLEPWIAGLELPAKSQPSLVKWNCACEAVYATQMQDISYVCTRCGQAAVREV